MSEAEEHQHYALHRLVVLADAVFAIAMTLLALELRPPANWDGTIPGLLSAMGSSLMAYGLSFLVIGGYWIAHTRSFHRFVRADRIVVLLSILGLGLVTLLPVATRLIMEHRGVAGAVILYVTLAGGIGVVNALTWGYGVLVPSMLHAEVTTAQKMQRLISLSSTPLLLAGVIFLAFTGREAAMWVLVAVFAASQAALRRKFAPLRDTFVGANKNEGAHAASARHEGHPELRFEAPGAELVEENTPGRMEMNRFEKAVYECMDPTAELLERTADPLHRAILLNFWRHVHLEGSGQFERITAPDMMVDHPVYRVTWGANPSVIEGKAGVLGFYNSVGEAVLWNSDDLIAVADWGVADELTFHQIAPGSILKTIGYPVEKDDAIYHVTSRQAFIWPYDERARLKGENLYEDKTSLAIEEIDPSEAITPARVREIHIELLAKLEARFGPDFWVYRG